MQVAAGVVGDPAPHRAAADLPRVGRPGRDPRSLPRSRGVEGLEVRADQHILVGAGAVRAPCDRAGGGVERGRASRARRTRRRCCRPAPCPYDQRRHRHGLALVDVAELRVPLRLAGRCVDRDGVAVERVEEDRAVGVRRAAVHEVAARDALRRRRAASGRTPLRRRAGLAQVERVEDVRKRRDDVHRVADDERRGFVAGDGAGREGPGDAELRDVAGVDLRSGR